MSPMKRMRMEWWWAPAPRASLSYALRGRSPRRSNVISACVLYHACFPEHRYLDLSGVFHLILDFLGYITRQGLGTEVIEIGGANDHPHLATGLNRVGLLHTWEGRRDLLQPL